jgi:hypothetical protein
MFCCSINNLRERYLNFQGFKENGGKFKMDYLPARQCTWLRIIIVGCPLK